MKRPRSAIQETTATWVNQRLCTVGKWACYGSLCVDGNTYTVGDVVGLKAPKGQSPYITRIEAMWEEDKGTKYIHGSWFYRYNELVSFVSHA